MIDVYYVTQFSPLLIIFLADVVGVIQIFMRFDDIVQGGMKICHHDNIVTGNIIIEQFFIIQTNILFNALII